MSTAQCAYCNKTFLPQRSTAKYCSGRCRTAYHRLTTNAYKWRNEARLLTDKIQTTINHYPELQPRLDAYLDSICAHIIANQNRVWVCQSCGKRAVGQEQPGKCFHCGKLRPGWIIEMTKPGSHF